MTDNSELNCEYTHLENGIHQFIFKDASLSAVQAYYEGLEQIYQVRVPNSSDPIRILMITPKKSLPINYMSQRGKEVMAKYPNLGTVWFATLVNNIAEARIADSFLRIIRLPGVRPRFFAISERDEAIQWLLEQT